MITTNQITVIKIVSLFSVVLLQGCFSTMTKQEASYEATIPQYEAPKVLNNGAIYQASTADPLFEDLKARREGDILTIVLSEKTNATKSAKTSATKDTTIDTGTPIVLGRPVTSGGTNILSANIESEQEFEGEGESEQSNELTGTVAVTVAKVLPNGNLFVRGQKRMVLNQGEEFVQISGIVRPVDIAADNTISSTLVADARITYSGKGAVADSNVAGWLARFFLSAYFPF